MAVGFFDKTLLKKTFHIAMTFGSIVGTVAVFIHDVIDENTKLVIIIYISSVFMAYIFLLIWANLNKKITLKIGPSTFEIRQGDIFKENYLKVINFNEYFDTKVDNRVIAKNSLNGKFITEYVDDISELDRYIDESLVMVEENKKRKDGKKKRYKLGEIVEYKGFLITSFTKFDENNMAYLTLNDYLEFLMNFWNNLNRVYANRTVAITLFGNSSLTRIKDLFDITEQELVEIILWTFKISKIKFKYPTKICLILDDEATKKINLFELKERY